VSVAQTFAGHDKLFKAQVQRGWRPSYVAVGAGVRYSAIWRNDKIGSWYEYTGMTTAGYEKRLKDLKARGYYPIQVSAGGSGSGTRYAAIWAEN
jgi:hypothetical protein